MKYTTEYCRNNKVAIKVNSEEELEKLYSYFPGFSFYKHYCTDYYYSFNNPFGINHVEYCDEYYYRDKGYEIITFQEFMESQMKQENIEQYYCKQFTNGKTNYTMLGTKKIIGYKCPISLFNGEVKKGTLFIKKSDIMYEAQSPMKEVRTLKFLPKEIVETWEAVYKQEFKVGDWIKILKYDGISEDANSYIGKLLKITELSPDDRDDLVLTNIGFNYGYEDFRKATQAEIDSLFNKTLTLSNGKEVIVRKGVITAQSKTVKLEDLKAFIKWSPKSKLNNWDISLNIESVDIGCWKKVKISDLELIIKTCQEQIELMED